MFHFLGLSRSVQTINKKKKPEEPTAAEPSNQEAETIGTPLATILRNFVVLRTLSVTRILHSVTDSVTIPCNWLIFSMSVEVILSPVNITDHLVGLLLSTFLRDGEPQSSVMEPSSRDLVLPQLEPELSTARLLWVVAISGLKSGVLFLPRGLASLQLPCCSFPLWTLQDQYSGKTIVWFLVLFSISILLRFILPASVHSVGRVRPKISCEEKDNKNIFNVHNNFFCANSLILREQVGVEGQFVLPDHI